MVCTAAYLTVLVAPWFQRRVKAVIAPPQNVSLTLPRKFTPTRPIYPYSVIRGGAYSEAELIDVLDHDPVVARHYSGFHRTLVWTVASAFVKPMYLSYRIGDSIYWTSRPVQIPRGETLLTDGHSYARARCGNMLSDRPGIPVNDTEPAPELFDAPRRPSNTIADLETWTEDRLMAPPSALFGETPTVSPQVISAVSGLPAEVGPPLSWWSTPPGGVLPIPISPSPIAGLIPPLPITPIIDLWPPTPFSPIVPGIPTGPTIPPLYPIETVPEPVTWIPVLLACAAFAVVKSRRS
jgi:hypothetical protein